MKPKAKIRVDGEAVSVTIFPFKTEEGNIDLFGGIEVWGRQSYTGKFEVTMSLGGRNYSPKEVHRMVAAMPAAGQVVSIVSAIELATVKARLLEVVEEVTEAEEAAYNREREREQERRLEAMRLADAKRDRERRVQEAEGERLFQDERKVAVSELLKLGFKQRRDYENQYVGQLNGVRYRAQVQKRDDRRGNLVGARVRLEKCDASGYPIYSRFGGNRPRLFAVKDLAAKLQTF